MKLSIGKNVIFLIKFSENWIKIIFDLHERSIQFRTSINFISNKYINFNLDNNVYDVFSKNVKKNECIKINLLTF